MDYRDRQDVDPIAQAIRYALTSPNESDRNGETANVVDGLYFIGRALYAVADAIANRPPEDP